MPSYNPGENIGGKRAVFGGKMRHFSRAKPPDRADFVPFHRLFSCISRARGSSRAIMQA